MKFPNQTDRVLYQFAAGQSPVVVLTEGQDIRDYIIYCFWEDLGNLGTIWDNYL
jgi:hypothetical protein